MNDFDDLTDPFASDNPHEDRAASLEIELLIVREQLRRAERKANIWRDGLTINNTPLTTISNFGISRLWHRAEDTCRICGNGREEGALLDYSDGDHREFVHSDCQEAENCENERSAKHGE